MHAMRRSFTLCVALCLLLVASSAALSARTTITWMVQSHPTMLNAWEAIIEAYESENPNVTVEMIVGPSGGAYRERMAVLASSNMLPDVIYLMNPTLLEAGAVMDLSELFATDPEIPSLRESWLPGVWEHSADGDQRFAMPIGIAMLVTYINTDHFHEDGLALPTDDWTWDDFLALARSLTRRDAHGITRWGLERLGATDLKVEVLPFVYQAGGRIFDDLYNPTKPNFADPRVVEGLEFLHGLRWDHHVSPRPGEPGLTFLNNEAEDPPIAVEIEVAVTSLTVIEHG